MRVENLVTLDNPHSPLSEVYRRIRTNIEFASVDKKIKILNVTSTVAKEGKTTTVCNLAIMYANKFPRVLLIDADLRNPSVHQFMKIKNNIGLTDCMLEFANNDYDLSKINFNKYINQVKHQSITYLLDVMPVGSMISNPTEFLGSNTYKNLLSSLKEVYDIIVVDSAPSGVIVDGVIVSSSADATLFVIEYNKIRIDHAKQVIDSLKNSGANVIGSLLTKKPEKSKLFNHYYKKNGYYGNCKVGEVNG